MILNRRHKVLLFMTLVFTGCSLLLGDELRESLGFLLLGIAFAWAVGSDFSSRLYTNVKNASGGVYGWVRLPVAMSFVGALLGGVLLYSRANPVLAVVLMCGAGIFVRSLTILPQFGTWLEVPRYLLGVTGFAFATVGILETDMVMSNEYAERFGQSATRQLRRFSTNRPPSSHAPGSPGPGTV